METINVTTAILEKDGNVFIAKRKKGGPLEGKWEFPGGYSYRSEAEGRDAVARKIILLINSLFILSRTNNNRQVPPCLTR
ncbi:MAG: NUDIX domain-containing protein [Nitrospirota bacterium]